MLVCPHCRHEFEPADEETIQAGRRDGVPHRGPLLDTLGSLSLISSVLALFLCGVPAIMGLLIGLPVWVMAQGDLNGMRGGHVDSRGRGATEYSRTKAIVGVVLGLLFGTFWIGVWIEWSKW